MLLRLLVNHLPGAEDDSLAIREVERAASLPFRKMGNLEGFAAVRSHAPQIDFPVHLPAEQYPLAVGPHGNFRFVICIVGQAMNIAPVQQRRVELRSLRIVAWVGVVAFGQLRMIARGRPDDSLAVRKVERARVVSAIVNAADVRSVDVQRVDVIAVVARSLCIPDDALAVR